MAGRRRTQAELNEALLWIVAVLHRLGLRQWYLSYGTLLGLVRSGQCIDGDDDVDIVISSPEFDRVWNWAARCFRGTRSRPGLVVHFNLSRMLRFEFPTVDCLQVFAPNGCQVDFYRGHVSGRSVQDPWNSVTWTDCLPYSKMNWRGMEVQIPRNPEQKLRALYGPDWRIPKNKKGKNNVSV